LVLDGEIIAPADGEGMVMRRRLAHNGVVSVAVAKNGAVRVAALGLPLEEDFAAFIEEAQGDVAKALAQGSCAAAIRRTGAKRRGWPRGAPPPAGRARSRKCIVTLFED
jgi:ribonuclease J